MVYNDIGWLFNKYPTSITKAWASAQSCFNARFCCLVSLINMEAFSSFLFYFLFRQGLRFSTWVFGKLLWPRAVGAGRAAALVSVPRRLHLKAIHSIRKLGIEAEGATSSELEQSELARRVCDACHSVLTELLGLDDVNLHCSLKLLRRIESTGEWQVKTWARSEPFDGRPGRDDPDGVHPVTGNSVWCALLGQDDGNTSWVAFDCFACNDLWKHRRNYANSREDWESYYRSVLVFPLKFHDSEGGNIFGFLTFDSPLKGTFFGAPDIYKHHLDPKKSVDFRRKLDKNVAAFHVGAILADALSISLRDFMKKSRSESIQ